MGQFIDREQPNRPNSVLRIGTSLTVTKTKASYTTGVSIERGFKPHSSGHIVSDFSSHFVQML